MNQYLEKAREVYESNGIGFQQLIAWHLLYGVVVCTPEVFVLGYYTDSKEIPKAVQREHSDTFFVTFVSGNMRKGFEQCGLDCDFLCFQREFKNSPRMRLYDINRIASKLTN